MIPLLLQPLLAKGLSLISNAVMAKGKEWVEEKAGIKLDNVENMSDEQLLQLKQFEMDHEEELLKIQMEDNRLAASVELAYLADVGSARDMQMEALKQEDLFSKRFVYYLTIGLCGFSLLYITAITFIQVPEKNVRFVDTVLGFLLGTILSQCISFFYGSSKASKDKDAVIKASMEAGK